jgi:hypothetical protein
MQVDVGDDGMALGKFLRVKVRIDITKPLMRGIMLNLDEEDAQAIEVEEEEEKPGHWCRFEYEFLPDFCFLCGLLGHIDRVCKVNLKKGEKPQFGSWLHAYISKQRRIHPRWLGPNRGGVGGREWVPNKYGNDTRGDGISRKFGFGSSSGRSGSDGNNWRKETSGREEGKETQVASPLKTVDIGAATEQQGGATRQLCWNTTGVEMGGSRGRGNSGAWR